MGFYSRTEYGYNGNREQQLNRVKMRNLIDRLNEETSWYDRGMPRISDKEWDSLYFQLLELEFKYGEAYPDSPTQLVTDTVVSKLKKVKHNHEMLSLAKTKDLADVIKFRNNQPLLGMCKMDGLTLSLRYNKGRLVSAETRGNGIEGEDVLHNVAMIPSIPNNIVFRDELIVDGEIICRYDDFTEFSQEYKNPRNFAAGSIRLLDANECKNRNLTFVAWEVVKGLDWHRTLDLRLHELTKYGFTVVPHVVIPANAVISDNIIEILKREAEKKSYPIDGAVFKFNDMVYGGSLGKTAHHFNNAIAFKFYDETYTTKLKDIEWTMGRTGVLTPVAILEPVDIDGTEVSRASLHNVSVMQSILGYPYYGQQVEVFKANMIIPQIASAIQWGDNDVQEGEVVTGIVMPGYCPICGKLLSLKDNDGVLTLVCGNSACEGKLINRLDHFCSKKGLDIKGLSKATLEKLMEWGYVNNFEDIFNLHIWMEKWMNKPGFGVKSVDKILTAIEEAKNTTFDKVISAAGIPLIGGTVAKDLGKKFESYESFRAAVDKGFDFSVFDGYGPEMDKAIRSFDYSELDRIVEKYLTINYEKVEEEREQTLEGKVFVITGKLKNYKNRDELKKQIEAFGGKVGGSVTKKTTYLINNDNTSTSSKNITAKTLGVPIITEEEFIKIFDI